MGTGVGRGRCASSDVALSNQDELEDGFSLGTN